MEVSDIRLAIKQIVVKELDLRGKTVADIADGLPLFRGGLGLDSLDALQLATALEERFGVVVPDDSEAKKVFYSVETLAEYVRAALERR